MLLWTLALFLIVEPIVGHVVEPMVYGHSTGLSPVAVVAAATFWTALWGPIGLVLATPLTVCLVVLGRHVERLEFLDVMFGDRPALSPPEIFYQRMLAGDPAEAAEKAEEFLKERSLASYYDEVALKGLQLAQVDAERGALDQERLTKIRDAVSEFASDLADQDDRPPTKVHLTTDAEASSAVESVAENAAHENLPVIGKEGLPPDWQGEHPVLCVAGRSLIDEAAAIMLAQLSTAHGLAARVEGRGSALHHECLPARYHRRCGRLPGLSRCQRTGAHALRRSTPEAEVTKGNHHPGLLGQGHRRRRAGSAAG